MTFLRCYGPALVLVAWAALLVCGVSLDLIRVPGLLAEAAALTIYAGEVRERICYGHPKDRT